MKVQGLWGCDLKKSGTNESSGGRQGIGLETEMEMDAGRKVLTEDLSGEIFKAV